MLLLHRSQLNSDSVSSHAVIVEITVAAVPARGVFRLSVILAVNTNYRRQENVIQPSERHRVSGDIARRYLDWHMPQEKWDGALFCMDKFIYQCSQKRLEIREIWTLVREQFQYDDDSSTVRAGDHTTAWLCRVPTDDELVVVRSVHGFDIRGSLDTLNSIGLDVDEYLLRGSLPFIYGALGSHVA